MLELAVLGLLKERSMHGYQLKKHLADTLGSFWGCPTARSTRRCAVSSARAPSR